MTRTRRPSTPPDASEPGVPHSRSLGLWLLTDLLLVGLFALLGRAAHDEGLDFAGWFHAAAPFLVALAVGWAATFALGFDPVRARIAAVIIPVVTISLGLGLRVLGGASAALPFVLVATGVLLVFLALPRAVATFIRRRR